ncbi:MAG: hypothetical protein HC904_10475, partial [Blastochloris sp.]|nr:hypothetical protein [Blastochloris sp.]
MPELPTSKSPKPGRPRWLLPVLLGLGVVLVLGVLLLVLGVAGAVGFAYFNNQRISPQAESLNPQSETKSYLLWQQSRQGLLGNTMDAAAMEGERAVTPGVWDRWFNLPPDALAQEVLRKRLPAGYALKEMTLSGHERQGENHSLRYRLVLVAEDDQFLVPVQSVAPAGGSKSLLRFHPWLIYARDLPAGRSYAVDKARKISSAGQSLAWDWELRSVQRTGEGWRVLQADPLPFERRAEFEARAQTEKAPGSSLLLRSGSELSGVSQQTQQVRTELEQRVASIEAQAGSYRQRLISGLPAAGVDRGGAGGTGTPTKAGVGTLAGAGSGALIGGGRRRGRRGDRSGAGAVV